MQFNHERIDTQNAKEKAIASPCDCVHNRNLLPHLQKYHEEPTVHDFKLICR